MLTHDADKSHGAAERQQLPNLNCRKTPLAVCVQFLEQVLPFGLEIPSAAGFPVTEVWGPGASQRCNLGPANHHPQNNCRPEKQTRLKKLHSVALFYLEDLFGHRQVLNLQVIPTTGLRASSSGRHFLHPFSRADKESTMCAFFQKVTASAH